MKRIFRSIPRPSRLLSAALAALLLAGSVCPTVLTVSATNSDLARGKRAFACHQESASLSPDKAVDGKSSTRYAGGNGCAHDTWFLLDLGDNYDLSAVHINWEAAHPSSYVLEVSSDGQRYTELTTVTDAATGWVKTAVSGTGRFLRIRELSRALAPYGFSIYDLEVYGTAAAESNGATYHYLQTDSGLKNGTLTLSHNGFVKEGTAVTATATPLVGGSLLSLTHNGRDVTAEVKDGRYTFTADGDATLSATFAAAPANRYECEDATVFGTDGITPVNPSILPDGNASGGKVAGNTGGKYFLFENVAEANCVQIAYASTNTNNMSLFIRYPWEQTFHAAGLIHFSTSNSWNMDSSYIASSSAVYIPAGSDIKIRPHADCNLDCLWLSTTAGAKPADAPANTVTAAAISDKAEADLMATYGHSLSLSSGESVTFTVPDAQKSYNVLSLSYSTEADATVTLTNGTATLGEITVSETILRTFTSNGMRTAAFAPGDVLTLTCTAGRLSLDYVAVNYAVLAEAVTVPALPAAGERLTVDLDGTWAMGIRRADDCTAEATLPDVDFINAAPVPGLWHSAAYSFGEYTNALTYYRRTVILNEVPTGQVLLYIEQAQYGRHIYVNGHYVDSYLYNYSHSYTDITDYLVRGENEIVIMLGSFASQYNAKSTDTHVLYDGESTEDEPGITGSVALLLNAAPEVSAVQTLSDLAAGTVTVQTTLKNRGDKVVTTDVTFTVYELGIFKDGKATQAEKKVAEFTKTGVTVAADGTVTVRSDAIPLAEWSREKCWSPDSPYLYRVEIRTAGDTYSSRFGMRTFDFDPVTKYPRLNGETFFMMGTNVAIERYYDDPLCGTTPWEEDWIRKLYSEFQSVNWNAFRVHLGNANEKWFDIADEMGFLIIDEYPQWGDRDGCRTETFMPEIYAWMDLRGNHPSLIMFDAQNEAEGDAFTDEIVRRGREYDLQKRPWDNGWRAPIGENDPIMGCHPYHIGLNGISGLSGIVTDKPVLTMANIQLRYEDYKDHPFLLEEHGEYWINREGAAMSGTAGIWNAALPGATNAERDTYYAELMAAQIEAYRAGRAYVGILFFCGLTSSNPAAQGITGDILAPDVSTAEALQIRPYTKELLANAFADLGISIGFYKEELRRGERVRLPITLTNDTGRDIIDLPVTLKIMSGDTVVYAERLSMSVKARTEGEKGTATEFLKLSVPAYRELCQSGKTLVVTASYELDGETVYSQRKWTLARSGNGDYTDDPLPSYDWLENGKPAETEPETETTVEPIETVETVDTGVTETEPTASDTTPTATAPAATTPQGGSAEGGCASAVAGGTLLALLAAATVAGAGRRKKRM